MEIERAVSLKLIAWKDHRNRKPLILQGARQVGKTWLLKRLGKDHFKDTAYFNFDQQPDLKQFFRTTKDPGRILENLSLVHGRAIIPGITLVIFDEIQECNEALNSLKYFHENTPGLAIACAGSLLGVAMSRGAPFPVGQVEFMHIYPVSFSEFLAAADAALAQYLNGIVKPDPIPDIFFNQLTDKLKMYYISGGMPEAIVSLLENRDIALTQKVLQDILNAYTLDFSKHVENRDIQKINYIWSSLPSQLSRENKKFLHQSVRPGARAREYEDALQWLSQAGLVHRVFCSTKPGLPLSAYDDLSAFKIYLLDTGLLRRLSQLDPAAVAQGNRLLTEFKGALTENFILQSLIQQFEGTPRYWRSGNTAEVDFLVQHQNNIIPIEVKSDENVKSKSLAIYRKTHNPGLSIRFSLKNLNFNSGLINIPLFMADHTKMLLNQIRN